MSPATDGGRNRWLQLALVVLVAAVFAQVRDHGFVTLRDPGTFLHNPALSDTPSLAGLERVLSARYAGNWIPITSLSVQLDHWLFRGEPAGTLLTNVALHALATLLLFRALARMTRDRWRSAFVAAVFAVHPLHVEAVAWASARPDVLSGVFFALTLHFYARYAEEPDSIRRYQLVAYAAAMGLLSKPMLVMLPFVLVLLDDWPLGRLREEGLGGLADRRWIRAALSDKAHLLLMVAVVGAVTLGVQQEDLSAGSLPAIPFGQRLASALHAYALYLGDAFWPTDLAALYPHPPGGVSVPVAVASALLLAALTAAAWHQSAPRPYLLVGWLWFGITLLPVSGLVQFGLHDRADRYTYVPLVGLAIAVAWGVPELAARVLGRAARGVLGVGGVAVVAALAAVAHAQVGVWRNGEVLLEHTLAVTRDNYLAEVELGRIRREEGRMREARRRFARAIELLPGWGAPYFAMADSFRRTGAAREASTWYVAGLVRDPLNGGGYTGLGLSLLAAGRFENAQSALEFALSLGEHSPELHAALAATYDHLGRSDSAVLHNREALRLDPDLFAAANNLAWILATNADPDLRDPLEAIRVAERALRDGPERPELLDTLAAAYAAAGRFEDAVGAASRAAELATGAPTETGIRARLALYRARRPYVEPPRSPPPGSGSPSPTKRSS